MAKFVIKVGKDGQHYFNLLAGNGQSILTGEGYTSRSACNNGIDSVKKNSTEESRFEKLESKNGKYYFVLKATNGQQIGRSEMYESTGSRDNGIESVMKNAPVATVEDED